MGNTLYLVRFHRVDGELQEDYKSANMQDADAYFSKFYLDNSGLYRNIDLLELQPGLTPIRLKRITF